METATPRAVRGCYGESARGLAGWVELHYDLLVGLGDLRSLGDQAAPAVAAVLDVPEVRQFRFSWELASALVEGDGLDAEQVLLEYMAVASVDATTAALFGR